MIYSSTFPLVVAVLLSANAGVPIVDPPRPRGFFWGLAVDLAAVCDAHDQDGVVGDFVDDAVLADSDPPVAVTAGEFFHPYRAGVIC